MRTFTHALGEWRLNVVGYMEKQPDITNSMRAILLDWLVEVGEKYKVQNEILYLAVNYINRFLSSMSLLRGKAACGHCCCAVSLKV